MNDKKLIFVGFLANVFEWYDFSVYAYLVSKIGYLFFPSDNAQIELIKAFFLFSVSYLIRPLGSLFFGILADRTHRITALNLSLLMMAIPTLLIGFLPTYANAGILAPISLIILRLVQGFAAGGELPGSACYVYEKAPDAKKPFYCSFVTASSILGVLSGSIMVTALYWLFNAEQILAWAWRIPFFFGFFILIFVFYLRKNILIPDDNVSSNKTIYKKTVSEIMQNKAGLMRIMAISAFIATAFYLLFVWMPSYLHIFLKMNETIAFLSGALGLCMLVVFTLIFGFLAPKIGRRNLALISIISIFILTYPLFIILKDGSLTGVILVQIVFALSLSCIEGTFVEMMASQFKDAFRARGVGLSFTLPTAIFGGIAPTVCSYLIYKTGSDISAIGFLIVMCLFALPAAMTLKQSEKKLSSLCIKKNSAQQSFN